MARKYQISKVSDSVKMGKELVAKGYKEIVFLRQHDSHKFVVIDNKDKVFLFLDNAPSDIAKKDSLFQFVDSVAIRFDSISKGDILKSTMSNCSWNVLRKEHTGPSDKLGILAELHTINGMEIRPQSRIKQFFPKSIIDGKDLFY